MENMKEELYNELHIKIKEDKEIINELISNYSNSKMYDDYEIKALVKVRYRTFKLNKAIELFNMHNCPIFINGMLIFNFDNDFCKRELQCTGYGASIDCWIDDRILVFSINTELIRTIETASTTLYREDETLL